MSTISPYLRLTLIGTGEQAGVWGTTTNNNFQYGFESAIVGYYAKSVAAGSGNYIAIVDGAQTAGAEYPNANYRLNGASGAYTLFVPPYEKDYTFWNNTAYTAPGHCSPPSPASNSIPLIIPFTIISSNDAFFFTRIQELLSVSQP